MQGSILALFVSDAWHTPNWSISWALKLNTKKQDQQYSPDNKRSSNAIFLKCTQVLWTVKIILWMFKRLPNMVVHITSLVGILAVKQTIGFEMTHTWPIICNPMWDLVQQYLQYCISILNLISWFSQYKKKLQMCFGKQPSFSVSSMVQASPTFVRQASMATQEECCFVYETYFVRQPHSLLRTIEGRW